MPHRYGHKRGARRGKSPTRYGHKRGARRGKSPTQEGPRFFGDVDAGKSKQDLLNRRLGGAAQAGVEGMTNAEKRRLRDRSGAQVTNAELEKFYGGAAAQGARFTNAEKRRMLEKMRDTSGGQVTNAVLKRYLRGQK